MYSIILYIEIGVYEILRAYSWVFIVMYIIAHAAYYYYFWAFGLRFPIMYIIPGLRAFGYKQLSSVRVFIIIVYDLLSIACLTLPSIILYIAWIITSIIMEYKFARDCIDEKPWLCALCPPYKFVRLVLDAREMLKVEED